VEDHVSEAKVREELEIDVSDFETAALILERIGFEERQRYEKYRETFVLGEVEIVIDELPYGLFVELEGAEEAIRETADLLGFDWSQRILESYLFVFTRMKAEFALPFDNLTFDNFADVTVSATDLYRLTKQ
jgi:adenylate cyclase class 2